MFHQTFQNHLNKFEGKIALPAFRKEKKIKCTLRVALFCLHFMVEIIRVSHIKKYLYTLWLCGKTFSFKHFFFSIIILFWTAAATTRNWHKFMILFFINVIIFYVFHADFTKGIFAVAFLEENKRWEKS